MLNAPTSSAEHAALQKFIDDSNLQVSGVKADPSWIGKSYDDLRLQIEGEKASRFAPEGQGASREAQAEARVRSMEDLDAHPSGLQREEPPGRREEFDELAAGTPRRRFEGGIEPTPGLDQPVLEKAVRKGILDGELGGTRIFNDSDGFSFDEVKSWIDNGYFSTAERNQLWEKLPAGYRRKFQEALSQETNEFADVNMPKIHGRYGEQPATKHDARSLGREGIIDKRTEAAMLEKASQREAVQKDAFHLNPRAGSAKESGPVTHGTRETHPEHIAAIEKSYKDRAEARKNRLPERPKDNPTSTSGAIRIRNWKEAEKHFIWKEFQEEIFNAPLKSKEGKSLEGLQKTFRDRIAGAKNRKSRNQLIDASSRKLMAHLSKADKDQLSLKLGKIALEKNPDIVFR